MHCIISEGKSHARKKLVASTRRPHGREQLYSVKYTLSGKASRAQKALQTIGDSKLAEALHQRRHSRDHAGRLFDTAPSEAEPTRRKPSGGTEAFISIAQNSILDLEAGTASKQILLTTSRKCSPRPDGTNNRGAKLQWHLRPSIIEVVMRIKSGAGLRNKCRNTSGPRLEGRRYCRRPLRLAMLSTSLESRRKLRTTNQ